MMALIAKAFITELLGVPLSPPHKSVNLATNFPYKTEE